MGFRDAAAAGDNFVAGRQTPQTIAGSPRRWSTAVSAAAVATRSGKETPRLLAEPDEPAQEVRAEFLPAGGLGRGQMEIGMIQGPGEEPPDDPAGRGDRPVPVEALRAAG